MPFRTDGSVHYSGIQNEKDIIDFLNRQENIDGLKDTGDIFIHIGGTKEKSDCNKINKEKIVDTISIKNHKTKSSTYDYINTSNDDILKKYKEELLHIRNDKIEKLKNGSNERDIVKNTRIQIANLYKKILRDINENDMVKSILTSAFNNYTTKILINNHLDNKLYYCDIDKYKKYIIDDNYNYFISNTNKKKITKNDNNINKNSCYIFRENKDTGEIENLKIRLRIVLNNGVTALLGLSKSNKNSLLTIKIQQESVSDIIKYDIFKSIDYN